MQNYTLAYRPGGTHFFTVNLQERGDSDLLTRHIERLRETVRVVCRRHPFDIHAWVVLPDHLHCILGLPEGETDFSERWRLIKAGFTRAIPNDGEGVSVPRDARGERGVWQPRFREHLIRDEKDYLHHRDYVHMNPVKHGLVSRVIDWPYSTFHRLVERDVYRADWSGDLVLEALNHGD